MALKASLEVRFLTLAGAEKLDPDLLFLERGIAGYDEVRRHAQSAMAFACRAALPVPLTASAEQKSRAAQAMFEIIAHAESEVTRSQFINEAAANLRLPLAAAQKDFQVFLQRQSRQAAARPANAELEESPPEAASGSTDSASAPTPERHLLFLCLHFEALGKSLSHSLPHEWVDTGHTAGVLLNRFLGEFEHDVWPGRDHLDTLLETPAERALVATLMFETPIIDDPAKVAQEGLKQLRARALEPRLRQIELALANPHADIESDPISLLKERSELQRLLRTPLVFAAV
ncbi:MAG: DNA primase, partial [Opitutaceae bacterium]